MVDAQPFAIWHPPGMSADVKKPASVPIPPVQPQILNKNVENLVGGIKWGDGLNAVKSTGPISSSRPRIHSISYNRTSVAPQQFHLSTNLPSKADEDESDSDSEDEVVKPPPVSTRKFSSSSPPKPILSSTPVNGNLTNTRPKPTEKISFTPSRGTAKENEGNLTQPSSKPIEKQTSQGPKVIPKQPSPPNTQFPELPPQNPGPKKPVAVTETKKEPTLEPKSLMKSPPSIEPRRITPPHSIAAQRKQETLTPVPPLAPTLSSQFGRQPLAPVNDRGFVTHNGFTYLNDFLIQLQDTAFDNMKLSIMEASIRQFHLIAADADIKLTRRLCSIKTMNAAEERHTLIEQHDRFMKDKAISLLTGMSELHNQLKEEHTMATRGLFDIPAGGDGWERSFPPSTASWKTPSPPIQSKSSESWKPASSPPKTTEVPKPQPPPSQLNPEPESTMPSFWKPSWNADLTEPPTPQVPPASKLATVEDVVDEGDVPEPTVVAPIPVWKNAKPAQVPVQVQHPFPTKNQIPTVADEPTPVWGNPWRKGKPSTSNNSSNQATKSAQITPPLLPVVEKLPTPPPFTAPVPEPAPAVAPTPSPAPAKPKTAKQQKNRKGKNKAATVAKEEPEEEEVSRPPPQPPVSEEAGLDAAIVNMVNTGNFQSTLDQFTGLFGDVTRFGR